ncbi:zinc finger Ran-binding domain-containing protein 2 isoform X3 [Toxorhynchites rutilus septentrionalis]|nr:zinc finger Ran-binding domain-containing protein 2 isoform X3 [Toxorhynchites rutilus septentrionalis]
MESVPHTGSKKKVGIEIGKVAAEKSRGLFSAEDWQCSKCANVNWARRHTCNLCNAPRFCEVEERTGYGGGYNDRGTVEYKEREESDDEYDEFGRRRKKRKISNDGLNKSTNEGSPEIPRKKTFHSTGENDDDDEEDDEDGDLSKYDLWGSDDQELMKDNISHTKRKHSHASPTTSRYSRSRSRSTSPQALIKYVVRHFVAAAILDFQDHGIRSFKTTADIKACSKFQIKRSTGRRLGQPYR